MERYNQRNCGQKWNIVTDDSATSDRSSRRPFIKPSPSWLCILLRWSPKYPYLGLLIPWHPLYARSGAGSVLAGLIQARNGPLLSALNIKISLEPSKPKEILAQRTGTGQDHREQNINTTKSCVYSLHQKFSQSAPSHNKGWAYRTYQEKRIPDLLNARWVRSRL